MFAFEKAGECIISYEVSPNDYSQMVETFLISKYFSETGENGEPLYDASENVDGKVYIYLTKKQCKYWKDRFVDCVKAVYSSSSWPSEIDPKKCYLSVDMQKYKSLDVYVKNEIAEQEYYISKLTGKIINPIVSYLRYAQGLSGFADKEGWTVKVNVTFTDLVGPKDMYKNTASHEPYVFTLDNTTDLKEWG